MYLQRKLILPTATPARDSGLKHSRYRTATAQATVASSLRKSLARKREKNVVLSYIFLIVVYGDEIQKIATAKGIALAVVDSWNVQQPDIVGIEEL